MSNVIGRVVAVACVTAALAGLARAEDTAPQGEGPQDEGRHGGGQFESARSVSGELRAAKEDEKDSRFPRMAALRDAMQPWYDLKAGVLEDTGLDFAFSYATLYQRASRNGASGDRDAASGVARFYGSWKLLHRGTENEGAFVYRVEYRHRLGTDLAPTGLAQDAGSITASARTFSDFRLGATIAYWRQRLFDGRATVVVGRVDPTDYFDMYALNSSQTHFLNKAFGTHPTVDAPSFGFGAAAGVMLTEEVYTIVGASDAVGSATQSRWNEVRDDKELFHHAEIGWTPSKDRIAKDNYHVGYWKTDRRDDAGTPSNWGLTASASHEWDDGFIPFIRAGFADGDTTTMDRVVTLGVGQRIASDDLLGVGFSWGRPEDRSLDDQMTAEIFYNVEIAENVHLTPDVQLIKDPALDPDESTLWIVGLRLRITF